MEERHFALISCNKLDKMLIIITDCPETFIPLGTIVLLRIFKNKIVIFLGSKLKKQNIGPGQNFTGCHKKDVFEWKCISWRVFISGMLLHKITSVKS